jgi:hypothetical protein
LCRKEFAKNNSKAEAISSCTSISIIYIFHSIKRIEAAWGFGVLGFWGFGKNVDEEMI